MAVSAAAFASIAQAIFGIGGTVLKIQGARQAAKTAEFEAQYAQRVYEFNSAVALQNAQLIEASALLEQGRARKAKQYFLGAQHAAFAKSGVRSDGTPFQVMVETAAELELDLQIDYFNAQVAAHAQRTQSSLDLAQASVARFNVVMAQQQRRLAPLTVALTGAPNLISNSVSTYAALKQVKTP